MRACESSPYPIPYRIRPRAPDGSAQTTGSTRRRRPRSHPAAAERASGGRVVDMTAGPILWIALIAVLFGLLVLFLLTTRRMSVLIARTRDLERVQRSVESIDLRLAAATDPLVARLGEIRRHAGDPGALARELLPAQAMLRDLAAETQTLRMPEVLAGQAAVMIHETERAVRAAELVEHGLDAMLAARGNRELEAQTSLKRGALNLRHAREAFGRAAADVAALRPADVAPRQGDGSRGPVPTPRTVPGEPGDLGDQDLDEPFEPRM